VVANMRQESPADGGVELKHIRNPG
jgi:hypothetical protein